MKVLSLGLVLSLLLTSSCGKKSSSDSKKLPPVTTTPIATAEEPEQPIRSWCLLDSMQGTVFATTRITFGDKRATVEYIRTGEDTEPALYLKSDDVMFERKTESEISEDRFVIEEVSGENTVGHLPNFDDQRYQVEKVLSRHKGIDVSGYFTPTKALIIETGLILSQKKTILYPCADFSPSLDRVQNSRPLIELEIELGQVRLTHTGTFGPVARELALKLPIDHLKPDFTKLAGKQFCAWSEFAPNSSSVEVLSIGKNFFRMNSYTDYRINVDIAADRQDLEARARATWTYVASSMNGNLAGRAERTYPSGEIITLEREFNMVTDATGRSALVRKNLQVLPADIYRDCTESRPTEIYPKFKKALPYILELEQTQAQR